MMMLIWEYFIPLPHRQPDDDTTLKAAKKRTTFAD
jgi:hypothetical protein